MKIKVCGLKQENNIKDIIEAGADMIGFIFYPKSERYYGEDLKAFSKMNFTSQQKVGVFVNEKREKVISIAQKLNLDIIQLHGNETVACCDFIISQGYKVIKAFQMGDDFDFKKLNDYRLCVDYFLFDTKTLQYGGSGKKFNWEMLKNYSLDVPVILSGGISINDIEEIKELNKYVDIYAVDINSKFEMSPGMKNVNQVRKFIKTLKNEVSSR